MQFWEAQLLGSQVHGPWTQDCGDPDTGRVEEPWLRGKERLAQGQGGEEGQCLESPQPNTQWGTGGGGGGGDSPLESNSAVTKCATVGGTSRWNC